MSLGLLSLAKWMVRAIFLTLTARKARSALLAQYRISAIAGNGRGIIPRRVDDYAARCFATSLGHADVTSASSSKVRSARTSGIV